MLVRHHLRRLVPLYFVRSRLHVVCIRVLKSPLGRLLNAWSQTPTKWYPLPLAVGALLLVVLQYRKKLSRTKKEVDADEEGRDVIRLKGPWQVSSFFTWMTYARMRGGDELLKSQGSIACEHHIQIPSAIHLHEKLCFQSTVHLVLFLFQY
jgi:hypothetical protein